MILSILTCFALASVSNASDKISDRIEFSGFGRIVGGYLDESKATYGGYSNSVSFSQQSLFALQSELKITDELSLSAQLLAHSGEERKSGIEWLYLNYEPNQNWRFKLGRIRTPTFRYSDVLDVGFSYPWITPPQQVYSDFLFSNYEGATGTFRFNIGQANIDIETYYGNYEGEIERLDETIELSAKPVYGFVFSINKGNLSARASVTSAADFSGDVPELSQFANIVESAGFSDIANTLKFDGEVKAFQASISYDTLDYFLASEWVKITSNLFVVPEVDSYYFTAGYNFYPFQAHITYAVADSSYETAENLIPTGIDPYLDQLSFGYDQIVQNLPLIAFDSVKIGLRWDLRHDISAKAEVTYIDGNRNEDSFFKNISDPNFDHEATLYQIALEWTF
jgi:hypothetical protein